MPRSTLPSYRCHRPRKLAFVEVQGKRIYLGRFGSPESRERYRRILEEIEQKREAETVRQQVAIPQGAGLAIAEVCLAYLRWADDYYVKDGKRTSEASLIRLAIRPLRRRFGGLPASLLTPTRMSEYRDDLIAAGLRRKTINKTVARVRRIFKWAVAREMVSASVWHALTTLEPLKKGRSKAPESKPVTPVEDAVVEATLSALSSVVRAMVKFQRLTGARPGEVCSLRLMDIDRSGEIWVYRPASHKNEHHETERRVLIGPKAQAVLRPFLANRRPDAAVFSPREAVDEMRRRRRTARTTPLDQGNSAGTNRCTSPRVVPAERYTTTTYNRAVARAVRRLNKKRDAEDQPLLAHWHVNQLRHTAATEIRAKWGLEAAQAVLGHAKLDVTQVYAERDFARAAEAIRGIG